MIKMDDCSNLDGKVSTTKKKRDKDGVALLPQQPSRSAKKRAVYFTKSDSELESEDDNIKAPKKRSFKKKANAINSNSNKFKLGPDADNEEMESEDEEKDSKAAPTPNIEGEVTRASPPVDEDNESNGSTSTAVMDIFLMSQDTIDLERPTKAEFVTMWNAVSKMHEPLVIEGSAEADNQFVEFIRKKI